MTDATMPTRLILVGGFLGAGKTTLLLWAARQLMARGLRVGLVTNDQGDGLVDTALAAAQRVPVTEVAGGCFCCRFPGFMQSLHHLQSSVAPHVILAEPVGSCTDLTATVMRPLFQEKRALFEIAPLTVLVDPGRSINRYDDAVRYLFARQTAEAEAVVVAKTDLLDLGQADAAMHTLRQRHAPTPVFGLSALTGNGADAWLDWVMGRASRLDKELDLDYARYAAAEARLGWLNATGWVRSDDTFSARNWLAHLLGLLDASLVARRIEIAHIKLRAATAATIFKASLTQSGAPITWDLAPDDGMARQLDFTLNARVEAAPALLETIVRQLFAEVTPPPAFYYDFTHFECFSPAPPQPTHRLSPNTMTGMSSTTFRTPR